MEHIFLHCSGTGVKNVEVLFVLFLSASFCSPLMDGFGGGAAAITWLHAFLELQNLKFLLHFALEPSIREI